VVAQDIMAAAAAAVVFPACVRSPLPAAGTEPLAAWRVSVIMALLPLVLPMGEDLARRHKLLLLFTAAEPEASGL
jgi:hypothetical protein